jgi:hypothetical protein
MNRPSVNPNDIEERLLALLAARGPGKTLGPQDVARALGGDHPDGWGPLMQPIRRVAVRLMKQGRVVVLRKGRPVDPDDFRGVYRLALPGEAPGQAEE